VNTGVQKCSWCGIAHAGGPEFCHALATNARGELDPQFCITCGLLLDHGSQDWAWNGDHHAPEHFACRRVVQP
jgi:hypothetical protein